MRKSLGIATFFVVGVGAAGAGALDNVQMKGSDTVFEVTRDLLAICPLADPAGTDGIVYGGGGSTTGETAMKTAGVSPNPQQTIAPMSRFLAGGTAGAACTIGTLGTPAGSWGLPSTSEGLVFAMDGVTVVAAKSNGASAACNGAVDDCDGSTDATAGLKYSGTITHSGGTYTITNWRDALRLIFAGMDNVSGNTLASRNCNSTVRQALVANYNNIFQNPAACATANCTVLQHAFIRDNESGTTDVFVSLLGLTTVNLTTNISPFCNALRTADAIPAGVSKYYPDFQDFDPIRRNCHIREEVCHKNGNTNNGTNRYGLGLVLAITPTDFLPSDADAFPITACASGKFIYRQLLPQSLSATDACPNGDTPAFGSECQYPQTTAGNFKCLNSLANPPTFVLNNGNVEGQPATVADGRVYNEYLLKEPVAPSTQPTFEKDTRGRSIVGAFYRIHSTKTIVTPAGGFCRNRDATSQIGCLVTMSPCSIGYAGRGASDDNPGTGPLKVNKLHPTVDCIQSVAYPLSRKLYVNTFQGFGDPDLATQELEMVKCFADRTKIDTILTNRGFVPLPTTGTNLPPGGGPYCEDFNESQCTGAPANGNACASNPAGVPTANTVCGNGPPGSPEFGEQCDDGNNVNGDGCNSNCQLEN